MDSVGLHGQCVRGAAVEVVKYEEVYLKAYESVAEARAGIGAYPILHSGALTRTTELRSRCSGRNLVPV